MAAGLRKTRHRSELLAAFGWPPRLGAFGRTSTYFTTGSPDGLAKDTHLEEVLFNSRKWWFLRGADAAIHGLIYLLIGTAIVLWL